MTVRFRSLVPLALVAILAAACATGGETRRDARTPPTVATRPERPLPQPIEPADAFRRAIEAGTRTTTGVPGPDYWQQWTDYTLTARHYPDEKRLVGSATIRYDNRSPDTLEALYLNLLQNLHDEGAVRLGPAEVTDGVELARVVVDGVELATGAREGPRYQVLGTLMRVVPPDPVAPGESVEIVTDYAFDVPQQGASGRMGYSGEDLYYLGYWYPVMAVYDDVIGWHTDQFMGNAEFYAGFANYDVTIQTPPDWLVISTGTPVNPEDVLSAHIIDRIQTAAVSDTIVHLVDQADFGETAIPDLRGREVLEWRFVADSVHDVAFSATRKSNWDATRTPVGDRDGDGETDYALINAIWRDSAPFWDDVARYSAHSIAFLSEFTGYPYPWPHMTAVEGGGIIGGGMEFPMMTLMGDYNTRGDSALYNVTAHELAHMWIPMIVSNNERRYGWMDEGTTTFNENMARMDFFPGLNHHAPDREDYLRIAGTDAEGEIMRWSDYHYPGPAYGVASYDKPATVLVALRSVLGEETFMEAFRAFFDRWAFKHAYPWDLFDTFEDVSGRDLDWFWHAWYHETWTLDQAVGGTSVEDDRTTVFVEDEGRVPMPVPLTVTCEDGATIERTIPVDPWLEGRRQTSIAVDCAASRVEIDAAGAYPDVDRSNNVWPRGEVAAPRDAERR